MSTEAGQKSSIEMEMKRQLERLKRNRPVGIWAWLSGKSKAHDRLTAKSIDEIRRIADASAAAVALQNRLERGMKSREEGWHSKERSILAERSIRIASLNAELRWLADAREALKAQPQLATEPMEALTDEVRKQRRIRETKNRGDRGSPLAEAIARNMLPSYRPR